MGEGKDEELQGGRGGGKRGGKVGREGEERMKEEEWIDLWDLQEVH